MSGHAARHFGGSPVAFAGAPLLAACSGVFGCFRERAEQGARASAAHPP